MIITSRPSRSRLTRWVDAWIRVYADEGYEDQVDAPPVVRSTEELCALVHAIRPETVLPDGPCTGAGS